MAIIRPSHLVGAISGALGSTIFATGPSQPIARRRPQLTDPVTAKQLNHRNRFRTAQLSWATLTEVQRLAWREFAKRFPTKNRLGLQRNISGFNYYVRWALLFLEQGEPIPPAPPEILQAPPILNPDVGNRFYNQGADLVEFDFITDDLTLGPPQLVQLHVAPIQTPGASPPERAWHNVGFQDEIFIFGYSFGPAIQTNWGVPGDGQILAMRARAWQDANELTGFPGNWVRFEAQFIWT